MFWKSTATASIINNLLKEEDCTLEQILDESEVLQEVTGGNKGLIEYLLKPENLTTLVTWIVTEPVGDHPEAIRYRYSNTASEILSSDVDDIRETIAKPPYLDLLFGILDRQPPLNPLLASFFSKVAGNLIIKKSQQTWINYEMSCLAVLEYLSGKENFIAKLQTHMDTSAIMDFLLKMISQVDGFDLRLRMQDWLIGQKLVESLIQLLNPRNDSATIFNAAQVICETIRSLREYHFQNTEDLKSDKLDGGGTIAESLLAHFQSPDVINQILDSIFDVQASEHSIVNGVHILLVYVEPKKQLQSGQDNNRLEDFFPTIIQSTATAVTSKLERFHEILSNPPQKRPVLTPSSLLEVPFGAARLSVCRLLSTFVELNSSGFQEKLVELNTMALVLDLFFKYSENNFLHSQVERTLTAILNNAPSVRMDEDVILQTAEEIVNSHPLLSHVLRDCRLVERILEEYEEPLTPSPSRSKRGYMGHLASIANSILKNSQSGENSVRIQKIFDRLPENIVNKWHTFVQTTLNDVNKKSELLPIESVTANAIEEEERESLKVAQRQNEEAALHMEFLAYQSSVLVPPFEKKFGFSMSEFEDGDETVTTPPETLVSISLPEDSEELSRRQALFEAACEEKIERFGDDEIWADRGELGFTSPGKSSLARCRDLSSSSSSDEDSDHEVENVKMEVDSTDPWSSFSVRQNDPPQFDDPWDSQSRDAASFGNTDNWANFENVEFGENTLTAGSSNKDSSMDCDFPDKKVHEPGNSEFVAKFEDAPVVSSDSVACDVKSEKSEPLSNGATVNE